MSVLALSRHTARVMRYTETRNTTTFRHAVRSWAEQVASVICEIQITRETRGDRGPGEITVRDIRVYVSDVSTDVRQGDVIDTLSGDNHPMTVEVKEYYNVRGHHLELRCEDWSGTLTGAST